MLSIEEQCTDSRAEGIDSSSSGRCLSTETMSSFSLTSAGKLGLLLIDLKTDTIASIPNSKMFIEKHEGNRQLGLRESTWLHPFNLLV